MFPLGYLEMKLIGQWLKSVMFLFGRNLWGAPLASGYILYLTSNTSKDGVPTERLIASRHGGSQHPYSCAYKTPRSEA